MVWNKHLEHGMKDWVNFFWKKGFKMGKIDSTIFIKTKENDIIVRNKARLVAQGFNQQEWIDYE